MSIDRSPKGSGGKFVCAISFVRLRMRAGVMQLRLQETRQMSSLLMKPTERTGEMMMFVTERHERHERDVGFHERHDPSSPAVFFIIPPFPVRAFLCNSGACPSASDGQKREYVSH